MIMESGMAVVNETVLVEELAAVADEVTAMQKYIEGLIPKVLDFGIRLVLALVFFFIGVKIINMIRKFIRGAMVKANADAGVIHFVDPAVKVVLYMVLILAIVARFGVDTTSVIALAGSAGVTIGLALQGSLSNFAGGMLILMMKPFRIGDYVIQGELEGFVSSIHLLYTNLLTIDNRKVVIPNGTLANNSLINATAQEKRMVDLDVGISYSSDIKLAKQLAEQLIEKEPYAIEGENHTVAVSELSDSAVVLKVRFWVKPEDYWAAKWNMTEEIKLCFDKNGIVIPFKQVDVIIHNQDA